MREVSDERRGRWVRMSPLFQMLSFGDVLDAAPSSEHRYSEAWKERELEAWKARSQSKVDRDCAQMRDDVAAEIADQVRDMFCLDRVSECFRHERLVGMHLMAALMAYKYGLVTRDGVFESMGVDAEFEPITRPDYPEQLRESDEAYWRTRVDNLNAALDELDAWDGFWPDPKGDRGDNK